jgi:hypothetical protein
VDQSVNPRRDACRHGTGIADERSSEFVIVASMASAVTAPMVLSRPVVERGIYFPRREVAGNVAILER